MAALEALAALAERIVRKILPPAFARLGAMGVLAAQGALAKLAEQVYVMRWQEY